MPKVGNIKFDKLGKPISKDSDAKGQELMLYFDMNHDYFYFKKDDIKEKFPSIENPPTQSVFDKCKERQAAINVLKTFFTENLIPVKKLGISIKVATESMMKYMGQEEKDSKTHHKLCLQGAIGNTYKYGDTRTACLEIEVTKYLIYKFDDDSDVIKVCDDKWRIDDRRFITQSNIKGALMEWTPEREAFLANMLDNLDTLGVTVMNWLVDGMANSEMDLGKVIDSSSQFTMLNQNN